MATKTIFGSINGEREITGGSGDFRLAEKAVDGVFTISFNNPFSDTPVVVANCRDNETNTAISAHIKQIENGQVQLATMNGKDNTAWDCPFNFIAIGPTDD